MMTCKFSILFFFSLLLNGNVSAQVDCEIIHAGSFVYEGSGEEVYISIDGKWHKEFHQEGKYYILSKIKWISDCEYVATIEEVTVPNFPAKKGAKMTTKILSVENNKITYESTVQEYSWTGTMYKLEKLPTFESEIDLN